MTLEAFEKWEPTVQAWECYDPERLKLPGLKVGIKDNINTIDFPTRRGSPIYQDYTPGNDARVVAKLKQAGCVIVGKTVTAEFGVHHPGKTRNPHDVSRTPGTSSSGSVVAVATGMVPVALGTQTAGSIIRPASWNGVYAFKPSFGLIPRTGILKTADTLDTVGFFVDTPDKLRTVFDILRVNGPDYPNTSKLYNKDSNFKVVSFREPTSGSCVEVDWSSGARRWPIQMDGAYGAQRILYHKSLFYYFQQEVEEYPELLSANILSLMEEGQGYSLDEYKEALRWQELAQEYMQNVFFSDFDILITYSSYGPAPIMEGHHDDSCFLWTLLGFPVVNVPFFLSPEGLPVGMQVIAKKYDDYKLLSFVEKMVEQGEFPPGPYPRLF